MPWFKFSGDFDYRPHPNKITAYKKGQHLNIPQAAADAAKEAGKGEESGHVARTGDKDDGTQKVRPKGAGAGNDEAPKT